MCVCVCTHNELSRAVPHTHESVTTNSHTALRITGNGSVRYPRIMTLYTHTHTHTHTYTDCMHAPARTENLSVITKPMCAWLRASMPLGAKCPLAKMPLGSGPQCPLGCVSCDGENPPCEVTHGFDGGVTVNVCVCV